MLDWRSVADAVFEALGVPVDELEGFALTEEFDVAVDVGEGDFAAHNEAHREVSTAQRIRLDELVLLIKDVSEDLIEFSWLETRVSERIKRRNRRDEKVKIGIRDEVHGYLIEIHVEHSFKSHRTGQVGQQTCDYIVHSIVWFLSLACYLRPFCDFLLRSFVLRNHLFHSLDDVLKRLVVNGQRAVGMLHDFIQCEKAVVRRGHHIIIFAWEDRSSEAEDLRKFFLQ